MNTNIPNTYGSQGFINPNNPNSTNNNVNIKLYESINKQCCCFNMRKVMRAVTQYFDRYLEKTDIRSTQFTLLVALASTTAKTLTEIADSLVMDRTTLTRNLKPLAKMELITIVQTMDKRSKAYALTEKGKKLVEACVPLWQQAQNNIVSNLSEEGYNQTVTKLEKLLTALAINNTNK